MTPQLQLAIRLLAMPGEQVASVITDFERDHPGVLVALADGEVDPADAADRELSLENDVPPFELLDEPPLPPAEGPVPDVWVSGNPPQARANRAMLPRVRVVVDADADAVREARWLLRALRQRLRTYENVVRGMVAIRPELATAVDPAAVRAITTRELATAIGLHESTLSRVATACRVQTLHGVYAIDVARGLGLRSLDAPLPTKPPRRRNRG
jgi:DNA-directed RNA polymerase specialized sigma54-like protein